MCRWSRRARAALKQLEDESAADSERLRHGGEDWLAWWQTSGHRELRCILMTAWDPIGVGATPEAWDEYDRYAPGIAHRVRDAADWDDGIEKVADYLNHVERDFMGILTGEHKRKNSYLAGHLAAWHEWSFTRHGGPTHD